MKNLILYFLLLSNFACTAQENGNFELSGKITKNDFDFIYLRYTDPSGNTISDSARITEGTFRFKGKLNEPTNASLSGKMKSQSIDDPNLASLFLEPSPMHIELVAGNFKHFKLKGSITQDEATALNKMKESIELELKPFSDAYLKEKDKEKAAAIKEKFEPFNVKLDQLNLDFINSHPDSYLSPDIMRFMMSDLSAQSAKSMYDKWTNRIKESTAGKYIAEEIKKLQGGSPGSPAASFSVKDINGQQLNLADFNGKKYVLLDFWASWCVPCRKGNPHLIALYNKYKDQGLEIIGVASDDGTPDAWRKAVEHDKIGIWKHVLSGMKRNASGFDRSELISEPYGIHSLPTKVLIDRDGLIIGRYGGGGEKDEALDKKLLEIFKN